MRLDRIPRLNEVLDAGASFHVTISAVYALKLRAAALISAVRNFPKSNFPIQRYIEVNRVVQPGSLVSYGPLPMIEILIACAGKDLSYVADALHGAASSSANPISRISIVVPDAIVDETQRTKLAPSLQGIDIVIVPETELVSAEVIEILKSKFGARYGWVLQQMLRNRFLMHLAELPTLVVDADTVLCFKRVWVTAEGLQVMTPTWEYNAPYYSFLKLRYGTSDEPRYTFIPHHMLFQLDIFREANQHADTLDDEALLAAVLENVGESSLSPFCLIYELYAQWIMSNYPERVHLERWSNRFVRRSQHRQLAVNDLVEIARLQGYCSVSFHSWS